MIKWKLYCPRIDPLISKAFEYVQSNLTTVICFAFLRGSIDEGKGQHTETAWLFFAFFCLFVTGKPQRSLNTDSRCSDGSGALPTVSALPSGRSGCPKLSLQWGPPKFSSNRAPCVLPAAPQSCPWVSWQGDRVWLCSSHSFLLPDWRDACDGRTAETAGRSKTLLL